MISQYTYLLPIVNIVSVVVYNTNRLSPGVNSRSFESVKQIRG